MSKKTDTMDSAALQERAKIDFRSIGFTDDAASFPRDDLALRMFAAFNGVSVDCLTEAFRYFPNEPTQTAWRRVADAAIDAILDMQPSTAENPKESAYQQGRFDGIIAFGKAIISLRSPW